MYTFEKIYDKKVFRDFILMIYCKTEKFPSLTLIRHTKFCYSSFGFMPSARRQQHISVAWVILPAFGKLPYISSNLYNKD